MATNLFFKSNSFQVQVKEQLFLLLRFVLKWQKCQRRITGWNSSSNIRSTLSVIFNHTHLKIATHYGQDKSHRPYQNFCFYLLFRSRDLKSPLKNNNKQLLLG